MSRLNFTKQDLANALSKKLRLDFRKGKERNAWYEIDGRKILRVTLPKGAGSIPPGTANAIRNQVKLSLEQFQDLVKCPLSGADYEKIIRDKIEKDFL